MFRKHAVCRRPASAVLVSCRLQVLVTPSELRMAINHSIPDSSDIQPDTFAHIISLQQDKSRRLTLQPHPACLRLDLLQQPEAQCLLADHRSIASISMCGSPWWSQTRTGRLAWILQVQPAYRNASIYLQSRPQSGMSCLQRTVCRKKFK